MSTINERESFFESMYANHPEKFNSDWEIYSKQEWVATNLRCDVIYKSKTDETLHLVEIKRHEADYPNIAQVMEYFAKLKMKSINIHKVYILAKGFSEELESAMEYCNITPMKINFETIEEIRSFTNDEIEGIYSEPLTVINNVIGELPQFPKEIENIDYMFKQYKDTLTSTPQSHYFEIWEFKVPNPGRQYYLLSIKYNGDLYHFKSKFDYMAGTKKSLMDSTRNFAWDFFKLHCLDKSYKNVIIRSYNPTRGGKKLEDT
ncbi:hypothetical protein [Bacillus sp. FJAT-47783]|uniref:hypothetical protein n=1 Tax=Bacillus sp. FJAT-47783 TaxID=2922712 RepID=UPI001FADDC29|nr:hypothetical protein [Bacillus sp. FJAT-47783]